MNAGDWEFKWETWEDVPLVALHTASDQQSFTYSPPSHTWRMARGLALSLLEGVDHDLFAQPAFLLLYIAMLLMLFPTLNHHDKQNPNPLEIRNSF